MAVGGKPEPDAPKPPPRKGTDKEPVFYHTVHEDLIAELIHAVSPKKPKLIVDLTPNEGVACLYALKHRIPCIAYPFNDDHMKGLSSYLTKRVFKLMSTEGNDYYDQELVDVLGEDEEDEEEEQEGGDGDPAGGKPKAKGKAKSKSKPKAKGTSKPKAKSKGKKAAKADDDDDEDLLNTLEDREGEAQTTEFGSIYTVCNMRVVLSYASHIQQKIRHRFTMQHMLAKIRRVSHFP